MKQIKSSLGLWFVCPCCEQENTQPLVFSPKEYEKPYKCQCGESFTYVEIIVKHDSLIKMNNEKIVHCQIWSCDCGHENHLHNPVLQSESTDLGEMTRIKDDLLTHQYGLCEECGSEFEITMV